MSWKSYETKVVSRDRIWSLMWIKVLMCLWEYSVESLEFFNFGEWCPQVEELPMWLGFLQDGFALLNGHGFMDRISISHLYDNFVARDCYLVTRPILWALHVVFWMWGCRSFISSWHSPLCTMGMACISHSWVFVERMGGGCFYHDDSSPILSGLNYITPNMGQYKPSATSELTQTSLETTRLINWPNKEQKYHALQKPLFTSSAIRHRIDNLSTRHSHNMTAQSTTSKIT